MKLKNTVGIVVSAAIAGSALPVMAQSAGSVEVEAFAKRYFTDSMRNLDDGTLVGGSLGYFLTDDTMLSAPLDRKSTRLNSSHVRISYAVFCLKKKKKKIINYTQ